MLFLLYLVVRVLARLLVTSGLDDGSKLGGTSDDAGWWRARKVTKSSGQPGRCWLTW